MTPLALIFVLLAIGAVLLVGELLLPTHGILGIAGGICIAGMIIACFRINEWVGMAVFILAIVTSPLLITLGMKLWTASPIGRRMILQPVNVAPAPAAVKVGQMGVAVSEMRPMGECDFGDLRIEAICELGMIHPGQSVRVIAIDNGRPTVRLADPDLRTA